MEENDHFLGCLPQTLVGVLLKDKKATLCYESDLCEFQWPGLCLQAVWLWHVWTRRASLEQSNQAASKVYSNRSSRSISQQALWEESLSLSQPRSSYSLNIPHHDNLHVCFFQKQHYNYMHLPQFQNRKLGNDQLWFKGLDASQRHTQTPLIRAAFPLGSEGVTYNHSWILFAAMSSCQGSYLPSCWGTTEAATASVYLKIGSVTAGCGVLICYSFMSACQESRSRLQCAVWDPRLFLNHPNASRLQCLIMFTGRSWHCTLSLYI